MEPMRKSAAAAKRDFDLECIGGEGPLTKGKERAISALFAISEAKGCGERS